MRRLRGIVIDLMLTAVLTNCASEPAPQAIPTTPEQTATPSTSAAATSTASGGASTLTPEPLPESAKHPDEAGQKAFVEHWLALYNYARQTGDTGPFMAISDPTNSANLGMERKIQERFTKRPVGVEGSTYRLTEFVAVPLDDSSQTRPTLTLTLEAGRIVQRDGQIVELDAAPAKSYWALLTYDKQGWRFDGLHQI